MPLRFVYNDDKWYYVPELNTTTDIYCRYLDDHHVKYSRHLDTVVIHGEKTEWDYKKCCKRGNDVYVRLLREKFKPLLRSKNHKQFFSTVVNKNRKRVRKTNLLYLTGTTSPEHEYRPRSDYFKTIGIAEAWLKFPCWWNSFITNIRQQFGRVDYIRAWQSQSNGYPHFHALIYFHSFDFTCMYWEPDKSWRVHNRQMLNGKTVRERIKNAWVWGNLDIKCCDHSKKALTDIVKYVTRDLEGGESDLTNAMVWYFGKQSFAISRGFTKLFEPDIALAEPSNDDLINASGVIQSSNSNRILKRIEVFPIIRHDVLPKFSQTDLVNWCHPPDPPPEVVSFLDDFAFRCRPVKTSKKLLSDGSVVDVVVFELVVVD
jgi:hypothetical protein